MNKQYKIKVSNPNKKKSPDVSTLISVEAASLKNYSYNFFLTFSIENFVKFSSCNI